MGNALCVPVGKNGNFILYLKLSTKRKNLNISIASDISKSIYRIKYIGADKMSGQLKLVLLKSLENDALSGYSIIKSIEQNTECWKPSTGSIYPLLNNLLEDGLVEVKKEGRKKLYSLTEGGKNELKQLIERKNEIFNRLIDDWKVYASLSSKKDDAKFMLEIFETMKKGEIPFKEINPELREFRSAVFRLFAEKKLPGNKNRIKKIIKEAVKKLEDVK